MNAVIYFYPKTARDLHNPNDATLKVRGKIVGYVRVEMHEGSDARTALRNACPIAHETGLIQSEID